MRPPNQRPLVKTDVLTSVLGSLQFQKGREVFSLRPLVPGGGEVGWVVLVLRPGMHGLKRVAVLGCDSDHNLEI